MKRILTKKTEPDKQFIIVNSFDQVFCGLKGGYPSFSEDWKSAKPLNNEKQFQSVQRGTIDKLEILRI